MSNDFLDEFQELLHKLFKPEYSYFFIFNYISNDDLTSSHSYGLWEGDTESA